MTMAAAIMEQRRLGLIAKAMLVVPGHCLAQAAREFLALYPNARILVADETNFTKDKRARFLSRAATATWDAIIITHSAFRFIAVPSAFEQEMIHDELQLYEDLLTKVDGEDRVSRKRLERLKEGLQERLEGLATRKDDLLTISEIGVDQIVVDEAQEFRKLSFATNMSTLKGIDPNGSQRAWDLYVKSRYIETKNPGRALVLASGTPITNTLGEMFSIQRLLGHAALSERGLHEFDVWASCFGDTTTELEIQPSGKYKPVSRFASFVNVPELIAMFRSFADVVMPDDLRQYVKVPNISTGRRQILTAKPTALFRTYQQRLDSRIKAIEKREGPAKPGDDILLSVITDGRHAAIDLRFVMPAADNEADNKLNLLVRNAQRIWKETGGAIYCRPDGKDFDLPGAAQMIFSDLGTINVEKTRGCIDEIGQDIARLRPTTGDTFTMMVLGQNHTERKEAGRALMREILTLLQLQQEGEVHLATIGGFDLVYDGERFGKGDGYRYETLLQRTGAEYEIDLSITVTPLGAISRLEHALDGFDEEQRQYRRRLEEAELRLASYQSRTGGLFQFATELDAKRKQLRDVEDDLAAEVIAEAEEARAVPAA